MAGKLYMVATPIGNMSDITQRAIDVLDEADTVCAEDTRVTGQLLMKLGLSTRLERCDENVITQRSAKLVERLRAGEMIAYCSDAGMPGISDPGLVLVDAAREAGIEVEVLPGASAVTTAVVAAGFRTTAFYFGGFLPRKHTARVKLLQQLAPLNAALVFYESPHRVVEGLESIAEALPERTCALCRELTKLHEEVLRLPAAQLARELRERPSVRGEIVLVIAPPAHAGTPEVDLEDPELHERIRTELEAGTAKSALAKQLAREMGTGKSELYDLILSLQ